MKTLIDILLDDHQFMMRLLQRLQLQAKQLAGIYKTDGDKSFLDELLQSIRYIQEYPSFFHHRLEESLYLRMNDSALNEQQKNFIARLFNEHEALEALSELLDFKISQFVSKRCSAADLLKNIDRFCRMQLRHMQFENTEIFPLALTVLQEPDWQALQDEAKALDPDKKLNLQCQQYRLRINPQLITVTKPQTTVI